MTLLVQGDPTFLTDVQAALAHICPCFAFTIDASGCVQAAFPPANCTCYCNHKAGCNLINELRTDAQVIKIAVSQGDNFYYPDDDTIWWSPSSRVSGPDEKGDDTADPEVNLAHELVHAWADVTMGDPNDEHLAVRGENQIRSELGLPARLAYTEGDPVDRPKDEVLDASDKEGCGCDGSRPNVRTRVRYRLIPWPQRMWYGLKRFKRKVPVPLPEPLPIPFGEFVQRAPDEYLGRRYQQALRTRERAGHRAEIDKLRDRFLAAPFGVHLESVGVVGGYRVVWMVREAEALALVTNLSLNSDPARPFVGPLGDLVEYRIDTTAVVNATAAKLERYDFQDGLGGHVVAVNGAVEFLWLRMEGRERATALYALLYEALHGVWRAPADEPDGARWEAVTAVWAAWRDLMRTTPRVVRVIARTLN